jgi:hypothetical protein
MKRVLLVVELVDPSSELPIMKLSFYEINDPPN